MSDAPTKAIRAEEPSYDEVVAAYLEARERFARVQTFMQFRAWKAARAAEKTPVTRLPAVGSIW